jgi:hypothetical protein
MRLGRSLFAFFILGALSGGLSARAHAAVLPLNPVVSSFTYTSITATWGSPGPTHGYSLIVSTAADFSGSMISSQTFDTNVTTLTVSGLASSTTYFVEVGARDPSFFTLAFATTTPASIVTALVPAPPTPTLSAVASGPSSITWGWNPIVGAAGYRVLSSTGFNLSGDLSASTTFFTQIGLSTNTDYTDCVAAFSVGASTSAPVTRYTLAAPPSGAAIAYVGKSSITFSWDGAENPAGTLYEARLWQAGGATTTLSGTETIAEFLNLSAGTTYFFNVLALNDEDFETVAEVTLSTATKTPPSPVYKIATVEPNDDQTILFSGPNGPVTIEVPAESFPEAVVITVQNPESYPDAASNAGMFRLTHIGVQIDLDQALEPSRLVTLRVPFRESDVAGLDIGKLVLARYDAAHDVWVPYVSRVNTVDNTVTAEIDHFSLYQIVGAAVPSSLDNVKIFPNPFRPSLGHTSVTISNVPANSRVRLYTVAGERVKELSADAAGMARWDGTNDSGQKAASGLYFVLVQGAGDKNRLRLVVQR